MFLQEDAASKEALATFKTHEDIAKVTFALGHEMVSTVDWLLTDGSPKEVGADQRALALTWRVTDGVMASTGSPDPGMTARLAVFRQTVHRNSTPLPEAVSFYLHLCDTLIRRHLLPDSPNRPSAMLAHSLFVRGMALRLGQLALGTIHVRSREGVVNASEYVSLGAVSHELLETAFLLSPRARVRWAQLQEQRPSGVLEGLGEDLLSGGNVAKLAPAFLEEVKQQLALLLLAREALGSSLQAWVHKGDREAQAALAFHASVAGVALVAVLLCLLVVACSLKGLGTRSPNDLAPILVPPEKSHCYM